MHAIMTNSQRSLLQQGEQLYPEYWTAYSRLCCRMPFTSSTFVKLRAIRLAMCEREQTHAIMPSGVWFSTINYVDAHIQASAAISQRHECILCDYVRKRLATCENSFHCNSLRHGSNIAWASSLRGNFVPTYAYSLSQTNAGKRYLVSENLITIP